MKFETEFNIGDNVFVIYNDVIQKAIITKITFPEPSLVYNGYNNDCISIYVWPQSKGKMPESRSYTCQISVCKRPSEVGKNINDLLDKMKKNAQCNGLTK